MINKTLGLILISALVLFYSLGYTEEPTNYCKD